jgi:hypothetical protein
MDGAALGIGAGILVTIFLALWLFCTTTDA